MSEFRPVVGYEDTYAISDAGELKRTAPARGARVGAILRPHVGPNGYQMLLLSKDNKKKSAYIHRLVAEAFCDKPEGDVEVNHIDGDKLNNTPANLEWVTHGENMAKGYETGNHRWKTAA